MLPLCREEKIGVIPWSPLARGRLTRDWDETTTRSETDEFGKNLYASTVEADRLVVGRVAEVAANRDVPRAQVALAWVLQKDPVTAPIIGATKMSHLEDAISALSIILSPEEVTFLEEPYLPHLVLGFR
jgi:aryl-alcohol dehydrogenase-like predicted oxidoreductase